MPSKIRKKVIGNPFTVNGVTHRTRVGCYEVKSRYGRQAVLLRFNPKREGPIDSSSASATGLPQSQQRPTALDATKMANQLKGCTICAVDARGRFLVETGGDYMLGAARTEEEMRKICKAERSIYEARKTHRPLRHPVKPRKPNTYTKFMGAFLATFHAVNVGDANAAWGSLAKEDKKGSVDALIQAVKDTGAYLLKTAPAST